MTLLLDAYDTEPRFVKGGSLALLVIAFVYIASDVRTWILLVPTLFVFTLFVVGYFFIYWTRSDRKPEGDFDANTLSDAEAEDPIPTDRADRSKPDADTADDATADDADTPTDRTEA